MIEMGKDTAAAAIGQMRARALVCAQVNACRRRWAHSQSCYYVHQSAGRKHVLPCKRGVVHKGEHVPAAAHAPARGSRVSHIASASCDVRPYEPDGFVVVVARTWRFASGRRFGGAVVSSRPVGAGLPVRICDSGRSRLRQLVERHERDRSWSCECVRVCASVSACVRVQSPRVCLDCSRRDSPAGRTDRR